VKRDPNVTIASFFEHDPPSFYELPFGFYDVDLIRGLLQSAGFKAIAASLVMLPCLSSSAADFAIGLVCGNPVSMAIQEHGGEMDDVIRAVTREIAQRCGATPVESTMQAFVWRAVHERFLASVVHDVVQLVRNDSLNVA
jgi:hypothetical protein